MAGQFIVLDNTPQQRTLDYLMALSGEKRQKEALQLERKRLEATLPLLGAQTKAQQLANQQAPGRFAIEQQTAEQQQQMFPLRLQELQNQLGILINEKDVSTMRAAEMKALQAERKKLGYYGQQASLEYGETVGRLEAVKQMTPAQWLEERTQKTREANREAERDNMIQQIRLQQLMLSSQQASDAQFMTQLTKTMQDASPASWARVNQMVIEGKPHSEIISAGSELATADRMQQLARDANMPKPAQLETEAAWDRPSRIAYDSALANMESTGVFPEEVRIVEHPGTFKGKQWMTRERASELKIADKWDASARSSRRRQPDGTTVSANKLVEQEVEKQIQQRTVTDMEKQLEELRKQLEELRSKRQPAGKAD
jgi:hypothetical protein